jgi:hypothetical protein
VWQVRALLARGLTVMLITYCCSVELVYASEHIDPDYVLSKLGQVRNTIIW